MQWINLRSFLLEAFASSSQYQDRIVLKWVVSKKTVAVEALVSILCIIFALFLIPYELHVRGQAVTSFGGGSTNTIP